ncbi:rust resistance kinase Lr10-like [Prunus yedoensis var. nudiflora]|uniref:Rust resistance kinase Lr10-like n=1 Tax=Prunus yedoensis var. nudiflora TaxID=2094558 RepID=A0A314Y2C3_PRUYE|nr:rust resistance kinase Lr10-like [Prunus yedoensis var. nudiflora]
MYPIPCLDGGPGYRVYGAASYQNLFYGFPDLKSCTRMYDVLSVPFGTWVGGGDYPVLRFKLSEPNCTECEAEGKRCRLKDNGIKSEVECIHLRKASKDLFHIYSAQFCRVSKAKQWNSWQRVQRWVPPFF